MTKTYKRKSLRSRSHVEIEGNLHLSGVTCVGGNLTVRGDLISKGPVFCLGRLVVEGEMRAREVVAGRGLNVGGDLTASLVWAFGGPNQTLDFEDTARRIAVHMPGPMRNDKYIDGALGRIVDDSVLAELEQQEPWCGEIVDIGGDCTVGSEIPYHCGFWAHGDVCVKEHFNPDETCIEGHLEARSIYVEGDLDCHQSVFAMWKVVVEGSLDCYELHCGQIEASTIDARGDVEITGATRPKRLDDVEEEKGPDLDCNTLKAQSVQVAGDVAVNGAIDCDGYLRADGFIIAGGPIKTGKKFGVLAGLAVPRDQWLALGYVCAPTRPANILTGKFRELPKRRRPGATLRPARLARVA